MGKMGRWGGDINERNQVMIGKWEDERQPTHSYH